MCSRKWTACPLLTFTEHLPNKSEVRMKIRRWTEQINHNQSILAINFAENDVALGCAWYPVPWTSSIPAPSDQKALGDLGLVQLAVQRLQAQGDMVRCSFCTRWEEPSFLEGKVPHCWHWLRNYRENVSRFTEEKLFWKERCLGKHDQIEKTSGDYNTYWGENIRRWWWLMMVDLQMSPSKSMVT